MAWYTKDYSYPVPRWKFPFRLKDENGKSYTGENAFNNRAKLGWIDVDNPPTIESDTQRMYWSGVEWVVHAIPESEFLAANTAYWVTIRSSRDDMLKSSDWSQMPVSDVVINTINISSDAVISTFSMTSNNAAIAVDDTVTFGSVTGVVREVSMVTPDYNSDTEDKPDDIVTVKTQMTEHVADGSIINFTSVANTEVSFTGVVESTVSDTIIGNLAVYDTVTSGSITGSISKIVAANSSSNIIKVSVGSDISEGSTITFGGAYTFDGTADSVSTSVAYGYHDSYIDTDASAEWATYRQELRDLPSTTANAHAVVWPMQPQ
jgi:hypothetical protein